jgi:hypothetical protein
MRGEWMNQIFAMLLVAVVAVAFYGVSYLKKRKMYPSCEKFALTYCELMDRLLENNDMQENIATEMLDGGLLRILPIQNQPTEIQNALQKPIDDAVLHSVRELFLLRDSIQSEASNGSFAKDKYNAVTNQVFDSLNAYLSILQNPSQIISQKDLDQFHYVLQKQKHIRNVTFAAIISRACAEKITIS